MPENKLYQNLEQTQEEEDEDLEMSQEEYWKLINGLKGGFPLRKKRRQPILDLDGRPIIRKHPEE